MQFEIRSINHDGDEAGCYRCHVQRRGPNKGLVRVDGEACCIRHALEAFQDVLTKITYGDVEANAIRKEGSPD